MSKVPSFPAYSNGSESPRDSSTITKDEEHDMWVFLHRKMRRADGKTIEKLDMTSQYDLWDEFKIVTNGKRSHKEYEKRFNETMSYILHETTFDTKIKTELYYGLSIPVEKGFVQCLSAIGDVMLDDAGCIRRFKEHKARGLDLGGTQADYEKRLFVQKLVYRVRHNDAKDSTKVFQMGEVKPSISHHSVESKDHGDDVKHPVMTRSDSSEELEYLSRTITDQEKLELWLFLYRKIRNPVSGRIEKLKVLPLDMLCEEFAQEKETSVKPMRYVRLFQYDMAPFLHLTTLDTNTKIKLYYGLNIPVEPSFLRMLMRKAHVMTDEFGRMNSYGDANGLVLHEGEQKDPINEDQLNVPLLTKKAFSVQEELSMWMFLLENVRNPMTGKAERCRVSSSLDLWTEFKRVSNGKREPEEYMSRYELILSHSLHLTRFLRQLKLELYYGLNLHVDEKFLKELRETAYVEIDVEGCIVRYSEKHGGGLTLGCSEEDEEPGKQEQIVEVPETAETEVKTIESVSLNIETEPQEQTSVNTDAELFNIEPESIQYDIDDLDSHDNPFSDDELDEYQPTKKKNITKKQNLTGRGRKSGKPNEVPNEYSDESSEEREENDTELATAWSQSKPVTRSSGRKKRDKETKYVESFVDQQVDSSFDDPSLNEGDSNEYHPTKKRSVHKQQKGDWRANKSKKPRLSRPRKVSRGNLGEPNEEMDEEDEELKSFWAPPKPAVESFHEKIDQTRKRESEDESFVDIASIDLPLSAENASDEYHTTKKRCVSERRNVAGGAKKSQKLELTKVSENSIDSSKAVDEDDLELEKVSTPSEPVIEPVHEESHQRRNKEILHNGSSFNQKEYLNKLREALLIIDSPDLAHILNEADEQIKSCKEHEKEIPISVIHRLADSAITEALYN